MIHPSIHTNMKLFWIIPFFLLQASAEQDMDVPTALASTGVYDHTADVTLVLGIGQEELEELLWFFRTEDSSTWNYSVLALSFVAMILGLVLLALNVTRNRKRKSHMCSTAGQTAQQAELEAKQALVPVEECSPTELRKEDPVPQDQRSGEVVVQWKDGTVTSLYTEKSEDTL
ncbi:organic solute transporter subunit beta isoform X1 [Pezoporus wallicus]|uniref:organic solute transporter subunit beta isoform X1 n=2 Tax=Pezoporus wallicus TaxID=35540 RepID=UPI00254CCCBD|nr:organic solute transporter subunit beta isoform X1 [Pezoporus wallicus]XP_061302609.1 organic solute transporter subunit beta isoform X1 [Pezoporus flaviventris]